MSDTKTASETPVRYSPDLVSLVGKMVAARFEEVASEMPDTTHASSPEFEIILKAEAAAEHVASVGGTEDAQAISDLISLAERLLPGRSDPAPVTQFSPPFAGEMEVDDNRTGVRFRVRFEGQDRADVTQDCRQALADAFNVANDKEETP
jgi:uncharacterized membrane protein